MAHFSFSANVLTHLMEAALADLLDALSDVALSASLHSTRNHVINGYCSLDGEELVKMAKSIALLEAELAEREREAELEKRDLLEAKGMLTKLLQQSAPKTIQSKAQVPFTSHEIKSLDDAEFQKLPQYLKGRLPLARINETVMSLNRILQEKYSLLMKYDARTPLSVTDRQRCVEWRQQEGDDLELSGRAFVTEGEVRGVIKLDPGTRNILSILRHVGRLRESRSAGVVRFLVQ